MAVDKDKIKEHIRGILLALGEDPDREGLRETPDRVARMYEEVFAGISYTNDEIAAMFNKTFEAPDTRSKNDIVLVKDIEAFSYCEHHMALMYDMKISVAYIPRDRVIGLSKIVRIVDMVTRRLQLQERIGSDIAEVMEKATGSPDVAVIIEAKHSCVTARGIKNRASGTSTTTMRGVFDKNPEVRDRLIMMMR
ncbi:MAG: GTP cyclohydrolase I FolE [Eubacterium sp.]|nr:GTP cyclohydrolase I FolE [Eubacterium sp.]HCA22447.1 GTP cyclohydrolase I FolE [Lachnospiraceae bacterium]